MMNMKEQKSLGNIRPQKDFSWEKRWVRPYESLYSIFLTFCRVNMIDGFDLRHMFGMCINGYKRYIPKFLLYDTFNFHLNSQHQYTELLPTWYQEQMRVFTDMDQNTLFRCLHTEHLYYCPKCLKESGYHSVLHQIRDIATCPFHQEQSIICSEDLYDYMITRIECQIDKSFRTRNAYSYQLPCFRINNNSIYQKLAIRLTSRYDRIWQECSLDYPDYSMKNILYLLSGAKSKRTMYVDHINVSDEHLLDGFITWFNRLGHHICHHRDFTGSYQIYKLKWQRYSDHDLLYFFIYQKFIGLIGDDLMLINPAKLPDYYTETLKYGEVNDSKNITNTVICDMVQLKVYFINMLHDGPYPLSALNFRWLEKSSGYENTCQNITKWGFKAKDIVNNNLKIYYFSRIDNIVVKCNIISDFIDELWGQFFVLASRPNGVSLLDAWKELNLPVYYVCHVKHEDYYEILRY